ncbi:response regulator [Novosphingobium resinovorum]
MPSHPIVLVVEDEPLILLAACDMAESAGFITKEATNATRALGILAETPSIAILFTDIDMPGPIDGMALAFEAQTRWPHIGIIITSGRGRWLGTKCLSVPCSSKSPTSNDPSAKR